MCPDDNLSPAVRSGTASQNTPDLFDCVCVSFLVRKVRGFQWRVGVTNMCPHGNLSPTMRSGTAIQNTPDLFGCVCVSFLVRKVRGFQWPVPSSAVIRSLH